jgi:hypothetical protein
MEREELRAKLDALSRQKRAAQEGLRALEGRRSRVRELQLSREKILARYIEVAHEELEKADGNKRSAVYNTLGVTIWAARTRDDPIRIEMSALGGEKVCHNDATSRRYFPSANPTATVRPRFALILKDGTLETAFGLDHSSR